MQHITRNGLVAAFHLFVGTMYVHAYNTILRPFYRIVLFIQPIVIATTVHMIFQKQPAADFARYVILGGGLAGIWSAMTFSTAGDVERERLQGVFSVLLAAPASLAFVFAAKIVMNALLSLLALVITFTYSTLFLGVPLVLPHPWAFLLALASFLFGASSFALFLANIFLLTRTAWIFQNVMESPLLILGGIVFPITVLPVWARYLSTLLPLRWGSEALYASMTPMPLDSDYWRSVGWTVVAGLCYLGLAHLLFYYIEYRVRQRGNLETA
jgi:ABC-2 type transport system permease protein